MMPAHVCPQCDQDLLAEELQVSEQIRVGDALAQSIVETLQAIFALPFTPADNLKSALTNYLTLPSRQRLDDIKRNQANRPTPQQIAASIEQELKALDAQEARADQMMNVLPPEAKDAREAVRAMFLAGVNERREYLNKQLLEVTGHADISAENLGGLYGDHPQIVEPYSHMLGQRPGEDSIGS